MTTELKIPPMWTLDEVRAFAIQAHGDQKYGGQPYIVHPDEVVSVLREFVPDADRHMLAAGYLHDVGEDTDVTVPQITARFGFPVGTLVYYVTDEPGENRRERKLATYPKIAQTERGVILKLADRLANVRACLREGRMDLFGMYRKEHPDFLGNLYNPDHEKARPLWDELNKHFPPKNR